MKGPDNAVAQAPTTVATGGPVWGRTLSSGGGVIVTDMIGDHPAGGWNSPFEVVAFGIALPRRGAFRRRVGGIEHVVDANTAFHRRAADEVSVAYFTGEPDELTLIDVDPDLWPEAAQALASSAGGPFPVSPQLALRHHTLLRRLRSGAVDDDVVVATVGEIVEEGVAHTDAAFAVRARRNTPARRRLVNAVCELLHHAPGATLAELARAAHYSAFHLCRTFSEETGLTISAYRTRLRVHDVLDRLDHGADDLAALAQATGFADHSHMTRTVSRYLGVPPSALRRRLRDLDAAASVSHVG